ncbi:MAG: hypothetical protein AABW57_01335 [Nanoarchaeota archaeon]
MKAIKSTKGQPLIQVQVPEIFQLQYDQAGKEAVKKVLTDYKDTRVALDTLDVKAKGSVRGSNIYFRFAVGNAYRQITQENIHPINARESEIALANNVLVNPRSTYEDLGLTVYPKEGVNSKLWNYLREQLKDKIDLSQPFIITGLMNVVKDENYENSLRLDLNELTEAYNVPILIKETGNFDSEDLELQRTGFPSELREGNRTLYTAKDGVRRLYRNGNLYLGAGFDDLAYSVGVGRVNVAKNFSSGNLEQLVDYRAKLEQEKSRKLEGLKQKYESLVKQVESINL